MALQIALGVGVGIYLGYLLIRLLPTFGASLRLGKFEQGAPSWRLTFFVAVEV